jgi:hypothetical protein
MTAFPNTLAGLENLLRERIVFDIGQFTDEQKRWLSRQVGRGNVQRTWNTQRFPQGKFMYWIPNPKP